MGNSHITFLRSNVTARGDNMNEPSAELTQYADAVEKLIHAELNQIWGDGRREFTECEEQMIMLLNRLSC
jgi:hypothetical protein